MKRHSASLLMFLVVIHLDVCLSQTLPARGPRCPSPTPCPVCPSSPPAQPAASASKTPAATEHLTERHICECKFNVMNTCGAQGAGGGCQWHLAFKAVKGNGRNVYQDFTDNSLINELDPVAQIINSNDKPFKNDILPKWDQTYVKEVKVEVFNNGEKKAWLLFNGLAKTRESWFAQENLIASSYNNLKTTAFTFFSVIGIPPPSHVRFFINENNGPCSEDCGYIAVIDTGANHCPWEKIQPKPYFLYTPDINACCKWNDATDCGEVKADIMFVIDVSGSISNDEFVILIDFVKTVVGAFPTGSDKTRFGAISFSNGVKLDIKLNDYFTSAEILTALDGIVKTGGGTRTDLALSFLKDQAYLEINGNRPGVQDVVFVLTDGASTQPGDTLNAITYISTEGYIIYTVAIGAGANQNELNAISSDPDSTFSLSTSFSNINSILDPLIDSACKIGSPVRSGRVGPPSDDKLADVFAISVKTCDMDW